MLCTLSAEKCADAAAKTAFCALSEHGFHISKDVQANIRHAATAVRWQWQCEKEVVEQARREGDLPCLCIYGTSDAFTPRKVMESYVDILNSNTHRTLEIQGLEGRHCELHHADLFELTVADFIAMCCDCP